MKSIAGYNVIKLLAKGGMSAIYLAEQESLQRQVILKFLNPELDAEVKKRFIDEGQIIASLKHPNIITVFDVVSSGKHNFIAMEYLPDGDLETRLQSKIDTYNVLTILSNISEALHLVHKQGIIHGDIKPANILFRGTCPLLTDFGISHRIEPKKEVDVSSDELYASPTYASPELIQGKPFDYRTDMYSLGIMMYEMLMGEKPFIGETEIETIANSIQNSIPDLPEELKGLQPLLESLLAKLPDERLSDAKLVTRFISQYLKDHPDLAKSNLETKLIDTDVVVEYIAKRKKQTPQKNKSNYLILLVLFLIFLLSVLISKDFLWETYIATSSESSVTSKSGVANSTSRVDKKVTKKASLPQPDLTTGQSKPLNYLLSEDDLSVFSDEERINQQKLLDKKNEELILIKKQLAEQQNLSQKKINQEKRQAAKRTINHLLKKGSASLKKYHLTTPLNDNALYYFQKVLDMDSKNLKAKKGIEDVVYRYELLARSELEKYNYQKAQSFISSGLSIDSKNERLIKLQKEANLQSEPKRVINKVKGFFKNF